jgi:hypothetical protein
MLDTIRIKVIMFFQTSQQLKIDSEKGNHCPVFVWMIDAMKFMLHSKETNLNKKETNVKSLTFRSIIRHHKCILKTQECSFVNLCVLMRCHQL